VRDDGEGEGLTVAQALEVGYQRLLNVKRTSTTFCGLSVMSLLGRADTTSRRTFEMVTMSVGSQWKVLLDGFLGAEPMAYARRADTNGAYVFCMQEGQSRLPPMGHAGRDAVVNGRDHLMPAGSVRDGMEKVRMRLFENQRKEDERGNDTKRQKGGEYRRVW